MSESNINKDQKPQEKISSEEIDFKYRGIERYRLTYDKMVLTKINDFLTYFNNFYPFRSINQYMQANYLLFNRLGYGNEKTNEDEAFLAQASIQNFDSYKI